MTDRRTTDMDWLVQYARQLGRNSRERHEKRIAMRRAWLDDTQADRDWHEEQMEWCK